MRDFSAEIKDEVIHKDQLYDAFLSKEERKSFLVEEAKASVIRDLHRLQGVLGRDATLKWLSDEFTSLPF